MRIPSKYITCLRKLFSRRPIQQHVAIPLEVNAPDLRRIGMAPFSLALVTQPEVKTERDIASAIEIGAV